MLPASDQGQAFRSTPAFNAPNGFIWKYFKNTIIFLVSASDYSENSFIYYFLFSIVL